MLKNIIISVLGLLVILFSLDNFGGIKIFSSTKMENCDSSVTSKPKISTPVADCDSCYSCNRDGGGHSISAYDANELINSFPKDVKKIALNLKNSGAFLSEKAIDILFDNDSLATGLVMCFVKANDTTISLVVTTDTTKNCKINYKSGDPAFICEAFCPKICGCFQSPISSNLFTILYQQMNLNIPKK